MFGLIETQARARDSLSGCTAPSKDLGHRPVPSVLTTRGRAHGALSGADGPRTLNRGHGLSPVPRPEGCSQFTRRMQLETARSNVNR